VAKGEAHISHTGGEASAAPGQRSAGRWQAGHSGGGSLAPPSPRMMRPLGGEGDDERLGLRERERSRRSRADSCRKAAEMVAAAAARVRTGAARVEAGGVGA
jgi:hypothetical protein